MSLAADIVLYESDQIRIGVFRSRPSDRDFETAGQTRHCSCVFPTTAVWIEHEDQAPFVADPQVVTLYHPGETYRRRALSSAGDHSHWFSVHQDLLRSILRDCGIDHERPGDRLFPRAWCRSRERDFVQQYRIFRHLSSGSIDPLWVEEATLSLLRRLVLAAVETEQGRAAGHGARRRRVSDAKLRRDRELTEGARAVLAKRFPERWTLTDLAAHLGTSLHHLSHVFKAMTGISVHAYLNGLRLRSALAALSAGHADLTGLALDLGFASHSHFSDQFRRVFGTTPSRMRAQVSRRL